MKFNASIIARCFIYAAVMLAPTHVLAHGDVTPHAVDTSSLPPLGDEWRTENPYRGLPEAIKVGYSGYTQNCARCHGLDAISGGMSPDLRKLDDECVDIKDLAKKQICFKDVDLYFVSAVKQGEVRNGNVYMPPFEKVFNQEAIWAIKSYLDKRRDDNDR
jgi:cytochrome c-550 PedF